MTTKPTLTLICLLAPLLAGADTLDVYGNLTGKTVLMPSALPDLPDSIVPDLPTDKTNAIATIEKALAEKGIEVVQDGPHFVRVFRKAVRDFLTNAPLRGAELASAKGHETASKDQEALPEGMIDFSGADVNQVLSIYALMRGRAILRPATLPAPVIRLKTVGRLTLEEALYAVETVLALNGISMVDDGAKFVQVVAMQERIYVKTNAPKPEPGAKLFDPNKVPAVGVSGPPRLAVPPKPRTDVERLEQEFERLRKAFYDFLHLPDPAKRPAAQQLFELYARLADKTAVASTNFDRIPIYFHVETPLTRSELLYAIETTIALNNLAIIAVDDRRIRLGRIEEVLRRAGKRRERLQPKQ